MKLPFISIVISTLPTHQLPVSIVPLKKLHYPKNLFEIIVVEGNNLSHQRNIGMKHARGKIIYYIDDDSIVRPNALNIIAKEFSNVNVAAAGGPSLSQLRNETFLGKLITYALETYFGALRMRYRYSKQDSSFANEFRLIGANLAIKKTVMQELGLFDGVFNHTNDETDLLRRISKKYLLRYNKQLFVYREQRKDIKALGRQFYSYGSGRMKQLHKSISKVDVIFLLPMLFPVYLISLVPLWNLWWYFLPLFAYLLLGIATSVKAGMKHSSIRVLLLLPFIFPIIHLSYSLGLLDELRRLVLTKRKIHELEQATVMKIFRPTEQGVESITRIQVEPSLARS